MFLVLAAQAGAGCRAARSDSAGPRVEGRAGDVRRVVRFGAETVQVVFAPGPRQTSDERVLADLTDGLRALQAYFGRLPFDGLEVVVVPYERGRSGVSGQSGGSVRYVPDASDDWVLTHELVHTAFPNLPSRNHWLEEGLATYVEPIARHRAGQVSEDHVWLDLVRGLPAGLPRPGDQGLDRTHTWGRTYWGGALFCFLADIELRRSSAGRMGLEHALRGVLAAGGDARVSWSIERALEVGDAATGTRVLGEHYAAMRADPYPIDLDDLFRDLGVRVRGRRVDYDDDAPLASVRRAITSGDMP